MLLKSKLVKYFYLKFDFHFPSIKINIYNKKGDIMKQVYIFNKDIIISIANRLVKRCKSKQFNFELVKKDSNGFNKTDEKIKINKNTVFFSVANSDEKNYCFSNGDEVYIIKVLNYKQSIEKVKDRKDYKRIDTSIKLKLNVPKNRY